MSFIRKESDFLFSAVNVKHYINLILLLVGLIRVIFSVNCFKESILLNWNIILLKKLFSVEILVNLDWVRELFFGVLLIIVFSVKEFSKFYMQKEKDFQRFFWILMLFVFSMCLLIFIPKLVFALVGWDGLGLTRFFLIIYYRKFSSWASGLKTYLINRLGDGFVILILLRLYTQGHWKILLLDKKLKESFILIGVLGFFTKRAQYPFRSWLPAAMAAPTPVSALVHSSTLVTAGVYLLIRFSNLLSSKLKFFIGVIRLYTLFIARFSACVEWDIKKIIAFSTLRQLGLMCFRISCGLRLLGYFHLLTHAVFKALLFIRAGFLLGQINHFQDLRQLNGIKKTKPFIDFSLLVRILALSGFPFLAGFFSKDLIIEYKSKLNNFFFVVFFWLSLILTVFYSFRIIFFLFRKKKCGVNLYQSLRSTKVFCCLFLILRRILIGFFLNTVFIKIKKIRFSMKIILLLLLLGGWTLRFFSSKTRNKFEWFFSNIRFVESNKSYFFVKKFSFVGKIFFNFDQGLSKFNNKVFKRRFNYFYRRNKNKFYLSNIKVHYFLIKIFLVLLFLKFIRYN